MIVIKTEKLLSTASVAARLGIGAERVRQLVTAGRIKTFTVETGMRAAQHIFRSEDVDAFAESRQASAARKTAQ